MAFFGTIKVWPQHAYYLNALADEKYMFFYQHNLSTAQCMTKKCVIENDETYDRWIHT